MTASFSLLLPSILLDSHLPDIIEILYHLSLGESLKQFLLSIKSISQFSKRSSWCPLHTGHKWRSHVKASQISASWQLHPAFSTDTHSSSYLQLCERSLLLVRPTFKPLQLHPPCNWNHSSPRPWSRPSAPSNFLCPFSKAPKNSHWRSFSCTFSAFQSRRLAGGCLSYSLS